MSQIDRKFFIRPDMPANQAYTACHSPKFPNHFQVLSPEFGVGQMSKVTWLPNQDEALPIGYSQTISAPHMHAAALELLQDKLHPSAVALDVGSGAACQRVLVIHALLTVCTGLTLDSHAGCHEHGVTAMCTMTRDIVAPADSQRRVCKPLFLLRLRLPQRVHGHDGGRGR